MPTPYPRSWKALAAVVALAALSLAAGCASEQPKADRTATPYVREPARPAAQPKPAPGPAATTAGRPGAKGAPSAAAPEGGEVVFYETDDEAPVAVTGAGPALALAVVRFDEGRIHAPGAADLEALAPERAGTAETLGRPVSLDPATLPVPPAGTRRTIRTLREAAGRLGAGRLLVVRFATWKGDRLLEASLHDVASGEVLGRYGPSEPSLSIAAAALHRLVK